MLSRSILYANDPVFSIRKEKKHFCSLILSLPLSLLPSIIAFHRKIHRRLHYIYIYIAPITIVDCKVWTNTHTHTHREKNVLLEWTVNVVPMIGGSFSLCPNTQKIKRFVWTQFFIRLCRRWPWVMATAIVWSMHDSKWWPVMVANLGCDSTCCIRPR